MNVQEVSEDEPEPESRTQRSALAIMMGGQWLHDVAQTTYGEVTMIDNPESARTNLAEIMGGQWTH